MLAAVRVRHGLHYTVAPQRQARAIDVQTVKGAAETLRRKQILMIVRFYKIVRLPLGDHFTCMRTHPSTTQQAAEKPDRARDKNCHNRINGAHQCMDDFVRHGGDDG